MSTRDLFETIKERRDRRIRNGRAEFPGFCISTKTDQSLPAVAEALPGLEIATKAMVEKRLLCSMGSRGKIGVPSNKGALPHPEKVVWEQECM
jgi:hypothetical protein